ncbi:MAG: M16 family metallopeptidase, partial [bacterium]
NFKGTPQRSPSAIARAIEGRGGHLNAFTGRESTCFYARVIDEQIHIAVDILSDITQHSLFPEEEIERERNVILEELKNIEDTPDEWVFENFFHQIFADHPLGRSIIGTRESLGMINREQLVLYRDRYYVSPYLVVAAAGRVNHNRLVRLVSRKFDHRPLMPLQRVPFSMGGNKQVHQLKVKANTQQTHIVWGVHAYPYNDPRKYALLVLNAVLGGGMSSRLFQTLRERHGLAYSVYSFTEFFSDTGLFGIYVGTEPQKVKKALQLIHKELDRLTKNSLSHRQLEFYKDQLKGSLLLGLESPSARMNRLGKMEIYTGRWYSLDEVVAQLDKVTVDDVKSVAEDLFSQRPQFTTMLTSDV